MKKIIILFSFLLVLHLIVKAQSNYIIAGQTSDMIYTDFIPDYQIPQQIIYDLPPYDSYGSKDIDLNRDGIKDFTIRDNIYRSLGGSIGRVTFVTSPECQIFCIRDTAKTYPSVYGSACDTLFHWLAKKYSMGDTMIAVADSFWQTGTLLVAESYDDYGVGKNCTLADRSLPLDSPTYYFFRLITSSDTLLSYFHFEIWYTILDYACQGPESIIINSLNEINNQFNVKVYPVPFTDELVISTPQEFEYSISDFTGKILLSGINSSFIDTRLLSSGCYLLTLKDENSLLIKRIIKME